MKVPTVVYFISYLMVQKEIEWRHNCLIKLFIFTETPVLAREKILSNSDFWSCFYDFFKYTIVLLPLKIYSFLKFQNYPHPRPSKTILTYLPNLKKIGRVFFKISMRRRYFWPPALSEVIQKTSIAKCTQNFLSKVLCKIDIDILTFFLEYSRIQDGRQIYVWNLSCWMWVLSWQK